MKNRFLSFLILLITTITVGCMFYIVKNNYDKNIENMSKYFEEKAYEEFSNLNKNNEKNEKSYKNNIEIDKELENGEIKLNNENKGDSKNDDDLSLEGKEKKKTDENLENEKIKEVDNATKIIEGDYERVLEEDNLDNRNSNYEVEKELEGESVQVFKVDKHTIPKKINGGDKLKLLSIAKSLSIPDYGILLEHIKRNDELDAAVDIFKILKDRLHEDEYNLIKDIMEPYINIKLIEEKIK